MTKVMEKIRAGGAPSSEGAAGASAFPAAPAPTLNDGGAASPSGFVAGEISESVAHNPVDERTASWDAQRVDPAIVAFHDRYSAICERYRAVRARLLTMNTAQAAQAIAISSAIPEEGKSVSTLNLGLVMGEGGEHRILLVDADFRRMSLARMLGIPATPGLAEVLRGELTLAEAWQPTPLPNLKLLPAGKVRDNAYGELLGGNGTAALVKQCRETFDYTFLDTPPITTVSDVCLLAPQCDGVILVIQMGRTPEPTVQQAVRTLQANNINILGSILSRVRERGSGYYERYYSHYYH
jgi:capsular exopolysaccharide synthesis family protein